MTSFRLTGVVIAVVLGGKPHEGEEVELVEST
jgi:hypothetical protein